MKLRVLVVEDDKKQSDGIEADLLQLKPEQRNHYGIEGFIIHKAMNEEGAMKLLQEALETSEPYDLILLDLHLPLNDSVVKESPEAGLRILKYAKETGSARGVIVESVFSMYDYVVKAFREGADDFLAKTFTTEVLQTQVLKYLEKKGQQLIKQRIQNLAPYAENDLAYKLGVCFSRFVQSVVTEIEGLEEGFKERWGLDMKRDSLDTQIRHVILLEEAVGSAKREWSDALSAINVDKSKEEGPVVCTVEEALNAVRDYVDPSLALKNVKLTGHWTGATAVRTFREDVKEVFREIILGALSELSDHDNSSRRINVAIDIRRGRAEVEFEDNLTPISRGAAKSINDGTTAPLEPQFERAWGLAVAQHIARRGGGRIEVQSTKEGNNLITYSIPLADHA